MLCKPKIFQTVHSSKTSSEKYCKTAMGRDESSNHLKLLTLCRLHFETVFFFKSYLLIQNKSVFNLNVNFGFLRSYYTSASKKNVCYAVLFIIYLMSTIAISNLDICNIDPTFVHVNSFTFWKSKGISLFCTKM